MCTDKAWLALDRARASPCDHHDAKELVRPPEVVVVEGKVAVQDQEGEGERDEGDEKHNVAGRA